MSGTLSINATIGNDLLAISESVRTVSGIIRDVGPLADVWWFARRVRNLEANAALLRRATEQVERNWSSLSDDDKRELYRVARHAAEQVDSTEGARGRYADVRITALRAALMRLFFRRVHHTIEDAEDAMFWFIDTVFSCAEADSRRVEAMVADRLCVAAAQRT